MKNAELEKLIWRFLVILTILFGGVGFFFEEGPWSKLFFILGGICAFAGHLLWLRKKRP